MRTRVIGSLAGVLVMISTGALLAQPRRTLGPQIMVDGVAMQRELASANDRVRSLELQLERICNRRCGPEVMELVAGIRHDLRGIGQELDKGAGGPPASPPQAYPTPRPYPHGGALMNDAELMEMERAVASQWQIGAKLSVVSQYAQVRLFTVAHIRRMADQFFDNNSRLRMIEIMAPRTVDPQSSARLEDLFWDASGQRAVRELFRNRRPLTN